MGIGGRAGGRFFASLVFSPLPSPANMHTPDKLHNHQAWLTVQCSPVYAFPLCICPSSLRHYTAKKNRKLRSPALTPERWGAPPPPLPPTRAGRERLLDVRLLEPPAPQLPLLHQAQAASLAREPPDVARGLTAALLGGRRRGWRRCGSRSPMAPSRRETMPRDTQRDVLLPGSVVVLSPS